MTVTILDTALIVATILVLSWSWIYFFRNRRESSPESPWRQSQLIRYLRKHHISLFKNFVTTKFRLLGSASETPKSSLRISFTESKEKVRVSRELLQQINRVIPGVSQVREGFSVKRIISSDLRENGTVTIVAARLPYNVVIAKRLILRGIGLPKDPGRSLARKVRANAKSDLHCLGVVRTNDARIGLIRHKKTHSGSDLGRREVLFLPIDTPMSSDDGTFPDAELLPQLDPQNESRIDFLREEVRQFLADHSATCRCVTVFESVEDDCVYLVSFVDVNMDSSEFAQKWRETDTKRKECMYWVDLASKQELEQLKGFQKDSMTKVAVAILDGVESDLARVSSGTSRVPNHAF